MKIRVVALTQISWLGIFCALLCVSQYVRLCFFFNHWPLAITGEVQGGVWVDDVLEQRGNTYMAQKVREQS